MKAFVTGASGFIGCHLVRALKAAGWEVRVLVHEASFAELPGIETVSGDILNRPALEKALLGIDVVFHLAAAVGSLVTDPQVFRKVNVTGTEIVLAAAQRAKVKRVIHFSSIGVLGVVKAGDIAAEDYPPAPQTLYDKTKFAAEAAAHHAAANGLDVVIVRPGWVYGPGDRRTFKFISAIRKGRFALIAGAPGRQTPVYIDDLVDGVLLAAAKGKAGAVYHLAGNEILTAEEMARIVASACGVAVPRLKLPRGLARVAAFFLEKAFALVKREAFLNRAKLSFFLDPKAMTSARAKQEIAYAPKMDFRTGCAKTVAWYQKNGWL